MDWEMKLIALYLRICKEYSSHLCYSCHRFTNGGKTAFTDEEVMTIYLFGILKGISSIKAIYKYTDNHLRPYFPTLPKYPAFLHRVNRLHEAFKEFINILQSYKVSPEDDDVYLVDSFPIMLAQHQHAYTAKVAKEVAGKGYNSTKKLYYYGVKAHVVARRRSGTLPDIEMLVLTDAGRQDGPIFDQVRPMLHDNLVFADQSYRRPDAEKIELLQNLKVLTPFAKAHGQKTLPSDKRAFSKAVSRMRQPIETLFGWVNKMTGIQNASLVRSLQGLLTHIFGRLAAAMLLKNKVLFDF